MKCRSFVVRQAFLALSLFAFLSACNGSGNLGEVLGRDFVSDPEAQIPPGAVDPDKGSGTGCHNEDPNHICLALKYVVFKDGSGTPVVSQEQAQKVVADMNDTWKQCNLSFQIDKYMPVNPADHGIAFGIANYTDLTKIRNTFQDSSTLLVATTGKWNRSGSLGQTGANAWTSLPGGGPYGAILESTVGTNANLIAHELGHYLNLSHVSDTNALMNPVIYSYSESLYSSQCQTARSAALYFWAKMIR